MRLLVVVLKYQVSLNVAVLTEKANKMYVSSKLARS